MSDSPRSTSTSLGNATLNEARVQGPRGGARAPLSSRRGLGVGSPRRLIQPSHNRTRAPA
eukprot:CAMPEP_0174852258 /NCGR_PEP_ID=MMETSP1114-20130205/25271_1 /TAXON_ID=312471 /ORGANISM="Neobodo designis, Strain CCAP 1951/1" /LENGTH=59 /DNA_ID=CAMNT_0016086839 /DNA_START=64 /DNA_END=240 /DNA_ORIENTATION=+